MRAGRRFARRDFGMVRVVAVHTDLAFDWPGCSVPIAASPAVGVGFPVAIGRSVATAAQRGALRQLDLAPVAGLQLFQVLLVVTVETVVVPVVSAVLHHDVLMLLRDNEILLCVESERRRLALLMADVTVKV